jgi:XisH protein
VIERTEPDRHLFLAIPELAYVELFEDPIGQLMIEEEQLRVIVFDPQKEEIKKWIP